LFHKTKCTAFPQLVNTKAGHGAGKPTSKRIDELADLYAFLFKTLNMHYHKP